MGNSVGNKSVCLDVPFGPPRKSVSNNASIHDSSFSKLVFEEVAQVTGSKAGSKL